MAMSFAALILSGVKSLASILVETSIVSMMSIPSLSTLSIFSEERGRAIAMTMRARATVIMAKGRCLTTDITEKPPFFHGIITDTLR